MSRNRTTRVGQLIGSCVVLGAGVGLILSARFGSDGYSSMINGLVRTSGLPYALVNPTIGLALVLAAWARGVRPGMGTITHPCVVGVTVNVVLDGVATPESVTARIALLAAGALVLALGVTGYLDAELGSGPLEGAAFALHPVSFRLAYNALQALGALTGWALGADVGVGTLVVIFGIGPVVHTLRRQIHHYRTAELRCPC